jgi:NAD(P)-dependent dehydrogenase (short-subunit alcohol dehydrogenase family)
MRSVLITGTSSGIGLATAVVLASRGWRVFATMRNLKKRGLLDQALRIASVQGEVHVEDLMRTLFYTIHPSSRALSLANFQARSRNSAWVIGTRLSSFVGKFFPRSPGEFSGL